MEDSAALAATGAQEITESVQRNAAESGL